MKQFYISLILFFVNIIPICSQKIQVINETRNDFEIIVYKNGNVIHHHTMRPKDELTIVADLKDCIEFHWKRLSCKCDKVGQSNKVASIGWDFSVCQMHQDRRSNLSKLTFTFPMLCCRQV